MNVLLIYHIQVRASATYALGTLVKAHSESTIPTETSSVEDEEDEEALTSEREIARSLLKVINDGSPLVRTELAIGNYCGFARKL